MTFMNKEQYIFREAPVPKAVMTLAVPTLISQLINIVYNYADTWYVGRTGNAAMVAALSLCMPVFVILAAIANLFGVGGASAISRSLGRGESGKARHIFAFSFWGGVAVSFLYGVIIFFLRTPLIYLIGGDEKSFAHAYGYLLWTCVIGAVPTCGSILCGHLVRAKGEAARAGFGMSLGCVLNMALDPLFMFVILPRGNEALGAAIATCLSNIVSMAYFVIFLLSKKGDDVFSLRFADISFGEGIPGEVFMIGMPAALATTLAMLSNIVANALISSAGSEAVAGMGVAKKTNMIAFNTCMGITQGVLPLIGYTYGAKNYARMKETIKFTSAVTLSVGVVCTVLFRIFSAPAVRFFIDDADSVEYGRRFLNVIAFAAPLAAMTYMAGTVFQATGNRLYSFVLSIIRKGLLDIPLMFLFSHIFGIYGVTYATPLAEFVSVCISVVMFVKFARRIRAEKTEDGLDESGSTPQEAG